MSRKLAGIKATEKLRPGKPLILIVATIVKLPIWACKWNNQDQSQSRKIILKNEGLEPKLSNDILLTDLLKNERLEPELSLDRLNNDGGGTRHSRFLEPVFDHRFPSLTSFQLEF
jgi:hypothetical protein